MAVFKRGGTNYHYRFFFKGEIYSGACLGCHTESEAKAYEKIQRETAVTTSKTSIDKENIEKIYYKQSGKKSEKIPIADGFTRFLEIGKSDTLGDKFKGQKESYWRDFVAYLKSQFPELTSIDDVKKEHAIKYIGYLQNHGRFDKTINQPGKEPFKQKGKIGSRTINVFRVTLKQVFKAIAENNPFDSIDKIKEKDSGEREIFSEDDITKIIKNRDKDIFCFKIVVLGIYTGLRRGDICTAKWSEIDLRGGYIYRKMRKTGNVVDIPIIPPLRFYLMELKKLSGDSEYVLPEHATLYNRNPDGVSSRFKDYLEILGIKSTEKIEGRTRERSIKDIHSLRHNFCYYAGVYGIPFPIVQSIVGHLDKRMTELYQRHATRKDKSRTMKLYPDILKLNASPKMLESQESNIIEIKAEKISSDSEKKIVLIKKILKKHKESPLKREILGVIE